MKDQRRRGGQRSVPLVASSASLEPTVLTISDEDSSEGSDEGNVESKEVIVDSPSFLEVPDNDLEIERADALEKDDPCVELDDINTTDISSSSSELMDETNSYLEDDERCEIIDEEEIARSTSDETTMEVEDNFDVIILTDVEEDQQCREANERDEKILKSCHPLPFTCPATRTRSWFGKQPKISYCRYFGTLDIDWEEEEEVEEEEEEEEEEDNESQEDEPLSLSKKKIFSKTCISREDKPLSSLNQKNKCSKPQKDGACIPREDKPLSSLNQKNKCSKPQKDGASSSSNKKKSSEPRIDEPSPLLNRAKSGKRKRDIPSKEYFIPELLVNTMLCDNTIDIPSNPPTNESCNEEPNFFSWDDEELKVVEKSDHEKFIDELWADFDFAMGSTNIGSYNADKSQEEKITNMEDRLLPSCLSGEHCFILDEQIGLICKFCSFVRMEIRHILPFFGQNMFRKSEMRNSNSEQDQLYFENLLASINLSEEASANNSRKTVWDLIPGVYQTMYQHQQEAFEFMWRNLAGGIDLNNLISHSKPDVVGGCVISHAPGTGKTRLSIVFIQTYMKVFPDCRPMIIAPRGMLLTWETEARKWDVNIPIHNLNSLEYTGKEDKAIISSLTSRQPRTKMSVRLVKLCSWSKGNSILGVSYNLFKKLSSESTTAGLDKFLLEKPGLLVLDEGHIPRNQRSLIWKVLGKVKAEKRLILSGTPFQNNFDELYNILCLVRPKFAEEITNNNLKLGRQKVCIDEQPIGFPEKDGGKELWTSLTSNVTDDNVEEVRSILKPFVHIHNGTILNDLPGMREYIILLDPVPHQKAMIEKVKHIGSKSALDCEYKYCLASIHPSLVTCLKMSKEDELLVDKDLLEKLKLNPAEGAKTRFVVEIVRLCESQNEKVLIFSQYIQPLTMIKEQLINEFNLVDGKEVLEMTGKVHLRNRQSSINMFNDEKSEAKVLLASTKACCEGISLTGASRVILIDVVWNPAVGRQATSRAFRIGQKKFVYTYNLITSGTGEKEKYDAQIKKDHLSKLLFAQESDSTITKIRLPQSKEGHPNNILSKDKILEQIVDKMKGMFIDIFCSSKE